MGIAGGGCARGALPAAAPPAGLTVERRARWCEEAERALSRTFADDREGIVEGVNAGALELWKLNGGAAWMVTRAARGALTICCLEGEGLRDIAPVVYRIAQRNGLSKIEFFTARRGLARLLRAAGLRFVPVLTVYQCEVEHVH